MFLTGLLKTHVCEFLAPSFLVKCDNMLHFVKNKPKVLAVWLVLSCPVSLGVIMSISFGITHTVSTLNWQIAIICTIVTEGIRKSSAKSHRI